MVQKIKTKPLSLCIIVIKNASWLSNRYSCWARGHHWSCISCNKVCYENLFFLTSVDGKKIKNKFNYKHFCESLTTCFVAQYFYRNMEDFVTWVDSSKIKQHVMNYNEEVRQNSFINDHTLPFKIKSLTFTKANFKIL